MFEMSLHDPFEHLKHKLCSKEGPIVDDAPPSSLLDPKRV
jgi:hypothetical protein